MGNGKEYLNGIVAEDIFKELKKIKT